MKIRELLIEVLLVRNKNFWGPGYKFTVPTNGREKFEWGPFRIRFNKQEYPRKVNQSFKYIIELITNNKQLNDAKY